MAKIKKVKKQIIEPVNKIDSIDIDHIKGLKKILINARKFIQYDLDYTNTKNITMPEFNMNDIKDAIVKVNIKIRQEDAHKIITKDIEDIIKQNCYILKPIIPNIIKEKTIRNENLTSELSPIEAVKVWIVDKGYKDAKRLLEISETIIREEGM